MAEKDDEKTVAAFLLGFAVLVPLVILWGTLPVWLIWNWYMPQFGLPALTFIQAVGICLLWDALAVKSHKKSIHWPTFFTERPLLIGIAYVIHLAWPA